MSRIEKRFAALKAEGRAGLVAYLTAGDPTSRPRRASSRASPPPAPT
jgi:tryptophan synthase alpha subunit